MARHIEDSLTKTDKRLKRLQNEKFKKVVQHKTLGINRGLSKTLREIMVKGTENFSKKRKRK